MRFLYLKHNECFYKTWPITFRYASVWFFSIYFSTNASGHTIASETCERQGFTTFPFTITIHNISTIKWTPQTVEYTTDIESVFYLYIR